MRGTLHLASFALGFRSDVVALCGMARSWRRARPQESRHWNGGPMGRSAARSLACPVTLVQRLDVDPDIDCADVARVGSCSIPRNNPAHSYRCGRSSGEWAGFRGDDGHPPHRRACAQATTSAMTSWRRSATTGGSSRAERPSPGSGCPTATSTPSPRRSGGRSDYRMPCASSSLRARHPGRRCQRPRDSIGAETGESESTQASPPLPAPDKPVPSPPPEARRPFRRWGSASRAVDTGSSSSSPAKVSGPLR
jgi:hypothetical protein